MHLDPTRGRSGSHPTFPTPQGPGKPPRLAWGGRIIVFSALVLAGAVAPVVVPQSAQAAVTSQVNATTLQVDSDAADAITITCAGGQVKVNGADPGSGPEVCSSLTVLQVVGGPGPNTIDLSGVDPAAFTALGNVLLDGREGDDTLTGTPLADLVIGGSDRDRLVAGRGRDLVLGGIADDVLVWNNGDGSDVMEGGAGADIVEVNGAVVDADAFSVNPNGGRVRFDRTNLVPFSLDIGTSENLAVNGGGGNDTITGAVGLAPLIRLGFSGGDGEDTLTGGDGDDVLAGGIGNDRITGFRGSDQMLGEADQDRMIWNNGDGSDLIEGAAGNDTVEVNGSAADGDRFTIIPNGGRVRFDRLNLVPFRLDIAGAEVLDLDTAGGDDTAVAAGGLKPLIGLVFAGGSGDDRLVGSNGDDLFRGGPGDDRMFGAAGDDIFDGAGGQDRLDGGRGADRLDGAGAFDRFAGGGGDDWIDARGQRLEPVDCGGGSDLVRADRLDLVSRNCEEVRR